jgi:hypothetical protein
MSARDGWYFIGPLVAVALIGLLGALFCRLGPQSLVGRHEDRLRDRYADGLAIFGQREDYGLLCPAVVTDEREVADEILRLLAAAGIRATLATARDGRVAVLVFAEEVDEARRRVGDSPAL